MVLLPEEPKWFTQTGPLGVSWCGKGFPGTAEKDIPWPNAHLWLTTLTGAPPPSVPPLPLLWVEEESLRTTETKRPCGSGHPPWLRPSCQFCLSAGGKSQVSRGNLVKNLLQQDSPAGESQTRRLDMTPPNTLSLVWLGEGVSGSW